MNREYMEELALQHRCEYCLAGVGVWCRTRIGAKATTLHYCRLDTLRMAYLHGYDVGLVEERRAHQVVA
jgi:hypothetical protein